MANHYKLLLLSIILLLISVFLIFVGFVNSNFSQNLKSSSPQPSVTADNQILSTPKQATDISNEFNEVGKVTRIVDGDTIEIELQNKLYKLRYIGVNSPETVDPRRGVECFGKEASKENKNLVEGKTVYLKKDVSQMDKFGRLLRYVYLRLDNGSYLFINDYLVREGFAQSSTYPPDVTFTQQLMDAQEEAREAKKGLWDKCQL